MIATYRVQLSKDFTFADLEGVLPYLSWLGISHIYLSPVFQSGLGSNHGYDVTDFSQISDERGGEDGLRQLALRLQSDFPDLKLVLDFVPNHMAVDTRNPYLVDVLAQGANSRYFRFFDFRVGSDGLIYLPVSGGADVGVKLVKESDASISLSFDGARYPVRDADVNSLRREFDASGKNNMEEWLSSLPKEKVAAVVQAQAYRLVPYNEKPLRLSYRRFFSINSLIGLRIEDDDVFDKVHERLFSLLAEFPCMNGVRVDHIDGLADPGAYLDRLAGKVRNIWVEKILAAGEELQPGWPIQGTTGYEFISAVNGLLVDADGLRQLEAAWREAVRPEWGDFSACAAACKEKVLADMFPGELERLCEGADKDKNFWRSLTCALPFYRTYKTGMEAGESPEARKAVMEWQQLTGPVMAKGVEDTAHYLYTPLLALNEVGCSPRLQDDNVDFWAWLKKVDAFYSQCLKASSTHDTKRSEDARHRLYVLSEMPSEWGVFQRDVKDYADQYGCADGQLYNLFLQSLLSVWPLEAGIGDEFISRLDSFLKKAAQEAKVNTDAIWPDRSYEEKLSTFVNSILRDAGFQEKVARFAERLAICGACNSVIAQTLKILSPGVPDIYQGTESWNFSLVDPDNRRPVDFESLAARQKQLDMDEAAMGGPDFLRHLQKNWKTGDLKLWLTRKMLLIRDRYKPAGLVPIEAEGERKKHVICYDTGPLRVVTARYFHKILPLDAPFFVSPSWGDTRLKAASGGCVTDLISGRRLEGACTVRLSDLLKDFPVAVLVDAANY